MIKVTVKDLVKKLITINDYRSKQYDRYTTKRIPIMDEENPNYLQNDVDKKAKPDRRIYNHFEGEIVDTKVSYFIGNPVIVNSKTDDNVLNEIVADFNTRINYEDKFAEITKDASASGVGGILLYNDNSEVNAISLKPNEFYVVYDLSTPVYALRAFTNDDDIEVYELYDKEEITVYHYLNGEYVQMSKDIHGFRRVPIIEVENNKERHSDYHSVCRLMDAYNRLISDLSNEIEAFRLAYMVLENYNATEEDLAKIRETGAITTDKDGKVYFLTKNINVQAIDTMRLILEKNIARFSGHVSFSETEFTGNLTEMAISFKVRPLEQKTSNYERKFKVFIRELYRTYFSFKAFMTQYNYTDLNFTFTRNLPINIKEEIENLVKLGGTLSKETTLGLMSFIDNPQEELAKLEKEQEVITNTNTDMPDSTDTPVEVE